MGKAEVGTPKFIANRMKAKGLQKLRWYCQMCQKQCRDENGFKCHAMSESHQRQLLLFADNPDKYLDTFSQDFLDGYLSLLKRRFGTKRVHVNNVYQEYIQDRHHIHMNATQWETLTDFVKWLGREGHCTVDETEKGWYVAYIDRDPETILRQTKLADKEKFEKDKETKFQEFINKQVELGLAKTDRNNEPEFTALQREGEEAISLNMTLPSGSCMKSKPGLAKYKNPLQVAASGVTKSKEKIKCKLKRSALEEIIEEEKQRKKHCLEPLLPETKATIARPWLQKNIVVKVITKDLGSKYYKEKGVVKDIIEDYGAIVKLLECGTKLKLDQSKLETVIPKPGREVLLLSGTHKGETATLTSIKEESFSAVLKLKTGQSRGKEVTVLYENFSKLATE